jgi:hypothetical protein
MMSTIRHMTKRPGNAWRIRVLTRAGAFVRQHTVLLAP